MAKTFNKTLTALTSRFYFGATCIRIRPETCITVDGETYMIRQLCFAAVAVLFAVNSCSASFVIDSFATEIAVVTGTSTVSYNALGDSYQGDLLAGQSVTITYNFTAAPFNSTDLADASSGGSLTALDFVFSSVPTLPLDLTVAGAASVPFSVSQTVTSSPASVFIGSDLGTATSLSFTFANNTLSDTAFSFGGSALTAVPEPTSLLMFPAAIGLVLARRRRKS